MPGWLGMGICLWQLMVSIVMVRGVQWSVVLCWHMTLINAVPRAEPPGPSHHSLVACLGMLPPGKPFDPAGVAESVAHVQSLIAEEVAAGIPLNRIVVGGFSQGGHVAYKTVLTNDAPLAGCIALSTWMEPSLKEVGRVPCLLGGAPVGAAVHQLACVFMYRLCARKESCDTALAAVTLASDPDVPSLRPTSSLSYEHLFHTSLHLWPDAGAARQLATAVLCWAWQRRQPHPAHHCHHHPGCAGGAGLQQRHVPHVCEGGTGTAVCSLLEAVVCIPCSAIETDHHFEL